MGDMAGLEWEVHVPPEPVEPVETTFDPRRPAPLSLWRLKHRAHLLNELPGGTSFIAHEPGRIQVEPYQLVPLMRALEMARPRLLLADGVGLGKTIQAGIIAVELIARRRAHRILIVAPSGPLLSQWEQETRLRFGLRFTLMSSAAELWEVRRAHELGANPFDTVSLCITALDFARQDHVLEEMERSAWDLVIIDEAHHCVAPGTAMSREITLRRRLAEVLARRSDALLLLTATPHDGHDAHFASLIALLDPSLVDGMGGFVGNDYRRHVIRRMKAHIRDPRTGAPLFRRRHVMPVKVDVDDVDVRDFHRALSAFVVPRLRRRAGADDGLAFVSLLKRSVSTISACVATLRVVMDRIAGEPDATAARRERARALRAWRRRTALFGGLSAAEEANQTALEIESMAEALRVLPDSELGGLIQLGLKAQGGDPKLAAMILEVRLIRIRHPRANILIYTEYTDSQIAATRILRAAEGIAGDVLTIGGQDEDHARTAAARRFSEEDVLILVSTDTLAEGLNLHSHCFHLIHLDLPYNPNRLEQRNGRIDRYGQRREPEIRYLYIPGTFEESLLLHLISKYETARLALDVMPDTLGVTAEPRRGNLTSGLSEDPNDLFESDKEMIQTLDRASRDSSPETVANLMREIDRGFDAFELMAVSHGWYGVRGDDALPEQTPTSSEDLADFVGAVAAMETGEQATTGDEIRLPASWVHGLDGLPGFEPGSRVLRFTREFGTWHDSGGRSLGFIGRAHPLILRAVRHGCGLPRMVAAGRGDHLGLLLTFELEIAASHRILFREIVGVMARPGHPPVEWRRFEAVEPCLPYDEPWDRSFAPWAEPARCEAELLADRIAARRHAAFMSRYDAFKQEESSRARRWLRARADLLCGTFVAPTGDLFGWRETGPDWRWREDPVTRLVSFATDPATSGPQRRAANQALELYREIGRSDAIPGPIVTRSIGMLMLVP